MTESPSNLVELSADVVAAYVSNNTVAASDIPALIASVHAAINTAAHGKAEEAKVELTPAVSVKRSLTPDAIICLEDGKRFKSLKRHLRVTYGMTPDQYRAKWNLPAEYPMVAPNYAASRSELAKSMGLGQQRRKTAAAVAATAPAKKGRAKKKSG